MKPFSRLRYFFISVYYKIRIPFDCFEGIWRLLYSELLHYTDAILHVWWEMPGYREVRFIRTIWGKFYLYGDLLSYLIMDPSFERPDMEFFVETIRRYLRDGDRILFLDVGANVGLYSIGLPTRLGKKSLTIHAFEPSPKYFFLLRKNIALNAISGVHLHQIALGDKNAIIDAKEVMWPGHNIPYNKVKFTVQMLDDVFPPDYLKRFDRIIIKMDIEGHEEEALRGAKKFFTIQKPILLMIEDAVRPDVRNYLELHKFILIGRTSPYNSFWTLH